MTTTHPPTPEQAKALDLFATGESLAIEAGAGAGKTSTLVMLANSTPRIGQYVAFNRSIVEDSRAKFPVTVSANTAHSLAMCNVGKQFAHRLNSGRMRSMDIARRLGVNPITLTLAGGTKVLQPGYLASLVMRSVGMFCQSADLAPGSEHVPYIDGIDHPHPETGQRSYANNNEVARALVPAITKAWADLSSTTGTLPYQHAHYLKTWQLNDPHIPADFIAFDECQDANPVLMAIVEAQRHAQIVWVGDSNQSIYGWTGALDALAKVQVEHRTTLSQSFRFGPAIADVANLILANLDTSLVLRGTPSIASSVGPCEPHPHAVLTRTNATAVSTVLGAQRDGRKAHLVGGGKEVVSFARAASRLKEGQGSEHPELACFSSWGEVQAYVEQDPSGDELRLLVNLVDDFTPKVVIDALDRMPTEAAADLLVSTAHKSKGREWSTVELAKDFTKPVKDGEEPKPLSEAELRLLYVAATRAQHRLDPSGSAFIMDLLADAVAS